MNVKVGRFSICISIKILTTATNFYVASKGIMILTGLKHNSEDLS